MTNPYTAPRAFTQHLPVTTGYTGAICTSLLIFYSSFGLLQVSPSSGYSDQLAWLFQPYMPRLLSLFMAASGFIMLSSTAMHFRKKIIAWLCRHAN